MAAMTDSPEIPTAKLIIDWPQGIDLDDRGALDAEASRQIIAKGAELAARGERPAFEVWYPNTTPDDFDAVEVHSDGTVETLPPYSELEGGSA